MTTTERDWAQRLIDAMRDSHIEQCNEATRRFVDCYKDGDSQEALAAYWTSGATVHHIGNEEIVVFRDGSCYVSWAQGLDRFFPDIDMVRDQYPDEMESIPHA